MHYTDKTHFFRDAEDNRVTVVTTMIATREYIACIIEGLGAETNACGKGGSRFAAIADLVDQLHQPERTDDNR